MTTRGIRLVSLGVWLVGLAACCLVYVRTHVSLPDPLATYETTWEFQTLAFGFRYGVPILVSLPALVCADAIWLVERSRLTTAHRLAMTGALCLTLGALSWTWAGEIHSRSLNRCAVTQVGDVFDCTEQRFYKSLATLLSTVGGAVAIGAGVSNLRQRRAKA